MTDLLVPHVNNTSHVCIDKDMSYGKYTKQELTLRFLIDQYTSGSCGVLATVIHQITGWPVRGIYLYHKEYQTEELSVDGVVYRDKNRIPEHWDKYPVHAICEQPNGRFIDAWGGGQTIEQITTPYKTLHLQKLGITDAKVDAAPQTDLHKRSPYLYTRCLKQDLKILLPEIYDLYLEQESRLCLL